MYIEPSEGIFLFISCAVRSQESLMCVCVLKLMNVTLVEQCNLSYLSSQGIKPKETAGKVCRSSTLKEF